MPNLAPVLELIMFPVPAEVGVLYIFGSTQSIATPVTTIGSLEDPRSVQDEPLYTDSVLLDELNNKFPKIGDATDPVVIGFR